MNLDGKAAANAACAQIVRLLHVGDNMFPVPPLFRIIAEESGADWSEMYKVFNCGHRLEVYVSPEDAQQVIDISKSFNIDAQVVGHIEEGQRSLTIRSEFGEFNY